MATIDTELLEEPLEGEEIELEETEETEVEDTDDGGAIIRIKDEKDFNASTKHFANIVDEYNLDTIVTDLLDKIERDKEARTKRDKLYEEGLRRTGLGDDAPGGAQFSGATKAVHPMLVEACVDFSARVLKEIFPPNGPVKSKILGTKDLEKQKKAARKVAYMNWQLTEQIKEFRGELEQLTTQVPLGGAQYFKALWNPQYKRPSFEFIPIDDIYLPFAATNFYTAERRTHVQYITQYEYNRRVKSGMYIDVDLGSPSNMPEYSAASKANDKIEGREDTSYNEDGLRTVFEVYTFLDLDDEGTAPYIISIDKVTGEALSLYRNWDKDDAQFNELEWIVEFPFIPWRGAYPIGLTHMIGGLSGSATGALRALLDSAHIQNIPTLLKLKGGPDGQTISMQPTEVAEIDGGALVDDIRKLIMAVPFNQPSGVLFQLLGFLVDAGKGVVQTSFEKLSDQNPNAPVGTTLALLEQGMVVFSSIHSRMHHSMGRVFKILHRINSAYLTAEDIEAQGSGLEITPSDFDGVSDVIPVSDSAIFSETQRFAQVQAVMQRAAVMPQMYNQRKVEEMFLRSLKLPEDILLPAVGDDDVDPVSENVNATLGKPIYVVPPQEHVAHLQVHMAFLQSPIFGMNPVIARTFLLPMVQHLRDHILHYYMVEAHSVAEQLGRDDPQGNTANEIRLIAQVQQLIEQELAPLVQVLPQIAQEAQKYAPPPPMADSSMAIAQLNAQMQEKLATQKMQLEQTKLQFEQASAQQEAQQKPQTEQQKIQLAQQLAAQKAQFELQMAQQKAELDMQREMLRQQAANQRVQAQIQSRQEMNSADNDTAMRIVSAEILSGEQTALSTGTGINPGS